MDVRESPIMTMSASARRAAPLPSSCPSVNSIASILLKYASSTFLSRLRRRKNHEGELGGRVERRGPTRSGARRGAPAGAPPSACELELAAAVLRVHRVPLEPRETELARDALAIERKVHAVAGARCRAGSESIQRASRARARRRRRRPPRRRPATGPPTRGRRAAGACSRAWASPPSVASARVEEGVGAASARAARCGRARRARRGAARPAPDRCGSGRCAPSCPRRRASLDEEAPRSRSGRPRSARRARSDPSRKSAASASSSAVIAATSAAARARRSAEPARVRPRRPDVGREERAVEHHVVAGEEARDLGVDGGRALGPYRSRLLERRLAQPRAQPFELREAQREVQIADRGRGGSAEEVVDRRDDRDVLCAMSAGASTPSMIRKSLPQASAFTKGMIRSEGVIPAVPGPGV